jgi:endoglucanase
MMIGEFASTETGGDKAAWITDTFQRIPDGYPQLRMIFWFNINKETDWRINSSDTSLESFKKAIAAPAWDAAPWPGLVP